MDMRSRVLERAGRDARPAPRPTLPEILAERARRSPGRAAYIFLRDGEEIQEALTYGELDRRVEQVAAGLQAATRPGAKVLLVFADAADHILAVLACMRAGRVAVSGLPPHAPRTGPLDRRGRRMARFLAVMENSEADAVLSRRDLLESFRRAAAERPETRTAAWLALDDLLAASGRQAEPLGDPDAAPAFIQYTSGSTGGPKGVVLSHSALLHNLGEQQRVGSYSETDLGVSWLPMFHDMGLIGSALAPLHSGFPCVLIAPGHFVERPLRWLEAISRHRATLTWGPNFAWAMCAREPADRIASDLDLSTLRIAVNSAEPVQCATLRAVEATFAPRGLRPTAMQPCYGLAEATLLVTLGDVTRPWRAGRFGRHALAGGRVVAADADGGGQHVDLASCGVAGPDSRLAIVDPETRRVCAPGRVGEIWFRGPGVADGYYRSADATRAIFEAEAVGLDGCFLRTGDLGFVDKGDLFVAGRLKDVIIVRGANVYPQELEQIVEDCAPEIRKHTAVAFGMLQEGEERITVLCELQRDRQRSPERVAAASRRAIFDEVQLELDAVVLVKLGGVPKTPSGKLQRGQCREALHGGDLPVLHQWKRPYREGGAPVSPQAPSAAADWLTEVCAEAGVAVEGVDLDGHWADLGLSSLQLVKVGAALRERFGVDLSLADIFDAPSIRALMRRVESERQGQRGAEARSVPQRLPDDAARLRAGRGRLAALRRARDDQR